MSTSEDKLADLERKVAMLELQRRLIDEKRDRENTPATLGRNLIELNQNMAVLLDAIGNQREDFQKIQDDIHLLKEGVSSIDDKLEQVLQLLKEQPSTHQ